MPNISVSDETYEKIKDQLKDKPQEMELSQVVDLIGKKWFFRTVTYHLIGEVTGLVSVGECQFAVLKDACWVADSGRFTQAVKDGVLSEVEIMGDWVIQLNTVTDFGPWNHPSPKEQK